MITINKKEISDLLLMEEYAKLHATESKLAFFEKKYNLSFEVFKEKILSKEVFDEYDDFIEWKAFKDRKSSILEKIASIKDGEFQVS